MAAHTHISHSDVFKKGITIWLHFAFAHRLAVSSDDDNDGATPLKKHASQKHSVKTISKPLVNPLPSSSPLASSSVLGGDQAQPIAIKDEEDKVNVSKGRHALNLPDHANSLWKEFEGADEESQFFFDRSDVTRRMLTRLAGNCANKCVVEGNEGQHAFARKHFQVMDQCIDAHRRWKSSDKDLKACAALSKMWTELEVFLQAAPIVTLTSGFMWDILLDTEVFCIASIRIGQHITHLSHLLFPVT